ncbi:4004_t:CDS:2 [Funneliformis caledonium]|uniref:4004_t:CDS:1 n=1 Tax=Funneliformis caledonium TaxID=1117310 RepID=A0A9N9N826_9GLOM|nr:4004_t:CDS:2 [Funneliformis caledonium]
MAEMAETTLAPYKIMPQYVLGSPPAIAIMGDSPYIEFAQRLYEYNFTVVEHTNNEEETNDKRNRSSSKIQTFLISCNETKHKENEHIKEYVERCTAKASVLERLSSLVSAYYIMVGLVAGFSMVQGEIVCEGWTYLPLLLSWTIPAIWRRGFYGILIVKDPSDVFDKILIIVDNDPKDKLKFHKRATVTLTALLSIVYPWVTVLIVYFTPPVGYFCRSKYAYFWHIKGESDLIMSGKGWLHVWFSTCGFIVAFLLLFLGIFTGYNTLWVDLFGDACDLSSIGCY